MSCDRSEPMGIFRSKSERKHFNTMGCCRLSFPFPLLPHSSRCKLSNTTVLRRACSQAVEIATYEIIKEVAACAKRQRHYKGDASKSDVLLVLV